MERESFERLLKRSGRKSEVIDKYLHYVQLFKDYLNENKNKELKKAAPDDLESFLSHFEASEKQSSKTVIYAILLYYKATKNEVMKAKAQELRLLKKSKKSPFSLDKILDIDKRFIKKLSSEGIKTVNDMILVGKSRKNRLDLAEKLEIPYEVILELVKISDLTRVGYVKEKLTRLYYNAGIQTPEMLSQWDAKKLRKHFEAYIKDSNWDGMVPNLSDLVNNIESAKKLPSIIEYEN